MGAARCALDRSTSLGFLDRVAQLVVSLSDDGSPQVLAEQHVERLGQLGHDRVVITDW
ncbi:MAG: hypothetical protein ABR992_09300 [Solirubrobacteraceae bacterium]